MIAKVLAMIGFAAIAAAQPKLQLTVHTGHGQVGYDVNSTMISGPRDMIVIDPQFSLSEAHKLAAEILESKKNLTTIYITHPHPDHMFGLAVLHQAFPEAKILALPQTVEKGEGRHITAHWLSFETGQRMEEAVYVFEARNAIRAQAKVLKTLAKVFIRISFPARDHARIEAPPRLVILFRIEVVGLIDEQLTVAPGFLYERGLRRRQAGAHHLEGRHIAPIGS